MGISLNSDGLIGQIVNAIGGSGTTGSGSVAPVNDQLVASFGSITLNAGLQPQNMVQIPNYNGLPYSSFRIHLSVTDTTGNTTAVVTPYSIENVIHGFNLQTKDGKNIFNFAGDQLDISNSARYLDPNGLINNAPNPANSVTATTTTSTWDIIIPFAVSQKYAPLKLFVVFNPVASRAATINLLGSVVNSMQVFASYHQVNVIDQAVINQTIPNSSTGNIALQSNYLLNRTYYLQAYNYGQVQGASAADTYIGTSGNGITFTPNGSLYLQNVPLATFIAKENAKYPNTVSAGVGHEVGMVNLFSDPFVATASTQLTIGFTTAPSTQGCYGGAANQMRSIWVVNLQ